MSKFNEWIGMGDYGIDVDGKEYIVKRIGESKYMIFDDDKYVKGFDYKGGSTYGNIWRNFCN